MHIADVWISGVHRLRHLGGYLPFAVDLTDDVRNGQLIDVCVRLDNRDTELCPPAKESKDLDFTYPGGLYRGVKLIVTNPVHVTDAVEANVKAGGGVFVTYSEVSDRHATVNIKTHVANDHDLLARRCQIRSVLINMSGRIAAESTTEPVMISSWESHEFMQAIVLGEPELWHPDSPNLYYLQTSVVHDGVTVDRIQTRIGIRTIMIDKRFTINGKEFHISGTNRHQEYPYLGYALSPNIARRDAQLIKDAGFNFVRLCHYPQDPAFIDACDELGILVQAPIPGWQKFRYTSSFVSTSFQNIRDLIRRDRNHASIVFWEPNLNETNGGHEDWSIAIHTDWCRAAYEIAHQEYPGDQCLTFGDHYPHDWTGWDIQHFAREYGDFGFGGNESTSRHTQGDGEQAMLQQAWNFQFCLNELSAQYKDHRLAYHGCATWVMFDYNRSYYHNPCRCGMMDIFRLPKYVYRFYQSQRDPKNLRQDTLSGPMIFIASDWMHREGNTKVVVYSNCEEVELSLNGALIARQSPDSGPDTPYSPACANIHDTMGGCYDNSGGRTHDGGNAENLEHPPFTFFDIPYSVGTLTAIGYIDCVEAVRHSIRTPNVPSRLKIEFDTQGTQLTADGVDAIFVRAYVLDEFGTVVAGSSPEITFSIKGEGRLIGTDPVHVEAGIGTVLLQTANNPGAIDVMAESAGLEAACGVVYSRALQSEDPSDPVLPQPMNRSLLRS